MQLADLIDIEWQLRQDEQMPPGELRGRDRAIGLALRDAGADFTDRHELASGWLRKAGPPPSLSPGRRIETALRRAPLLLAATGAAGGWSAATVALAYDGSFPVNVVHFLFVFVFLQLLVLALFAVSTALRRSFSLLPHLGPLQRSLRGLLYPTGRLAAWLIGRLPDENRHVLMARLGRLRDAAGERPRGALGLGDLRGAGALYGAIESWTLVSLTQWFAVAFNASALARCLYLVAFTDLAFSWSTTLDVSAAQFHRLVELIAAPFGWALPGAVPSEELVASSRYFRLDRTFGGAAAGAAQAAWVAEWWRFLVASLLTYALLPRLLLLLAACYGARRALASVSLDSARLLALFERLQTPLVDTRAVTSEPLPAGVAEGSGGAIPDLPAEPAIEGGGPPHERPCIALSWGEDWIAPPELARLIQGRFGWRVTGAFEAGGARLEDEHAAVEAVRAGLARRAQPIVIAVEAWEVASEELLSLLGALRAAAGERGRIIVGLVAHTAAGGWQAPREEDRKAWMRAVNAVGDPYLAVEVLAEAA
ncbi:MAG: DUF2868 domain-containing protein [Candidatus Schekmanbacteria bacterium]|nr:DUF2868 domain-containing protein [Candidatus Schekmanbacteria bacterium]